MSPYLQLCEKYEKHPQAESFGHYISWHMEHGFVYSTPDFFIMGRPIRRYKLEEETQEAIDRMFIFERQKADCWYIHAMSGDMNRAWDILPYPLGYVAWERVEGSGRRLQITSTETLRRLSKIA